MSGSIRAVEGLLRQFHDTPVPTEQTKDRDLALIYDYLIDVCPHPDGSLHWFCEEAAGVTREAATFLLRLFAYGTDKALRWRTMLLKCTSTCCNCVTALEERKWSSKDTYAFILLFLLIFLSLTRCSYYGAIPRHVLLEFYNAMAKWEAQEILNILASVGIAEGSSQQLSLAPPAITYQMVCNVRILQDARILSILRSCAPSSPISEWPVNTLPPGLFVLFMNDNIEVRKWAMMQSERCHQVPLPPSQFTYAHAQLLEHMVTVVDGTMSSSPFCVSSDRDVQWLGLKLAVRRCPAQALIAGPNIKIDVRKLASSHIQDQGSRAFENLIRFAINMQR
jgi:senataxin